MNTNFAGSALSRHELVRRFEQISSWKPESAPPPSELTDVYRGSVGDALLKHASTEKILGQVPGESLMEIRDAARSQATVLEVKKARIESAFGRRMGIFSAVGAAVGVAAAVAWGAGPVMVGFAGAIAAAGTAFVTSLGHHLAMGRQSYLIERMEGFASTVERWGKAMDPGQQQMGDPTTLVKGLDSNAKRELARQLLEDADKSAAGGVGVQPGAVVMGGVRVRTRPA